MCMMSIVKNDKWRFKICSSVHPLGHPPSLRLFPGRIILPSHVSIHHPLLSASSQSLTVGAIECSTRPAQSVGTTRSSAPLCLVVLLRPTCSLSRTLSAAACNTRWTSGLGLFGSFPKTEESRDLAGLPVPLELALESRLETESGGRPLLTTMQSLVSETESAGCSEDLSDGRVAAWGLAR